VGASEILLMTFSFHELQASLASQIGASLDDECNKKLNSGVIDNQVEIGQNGVLLAVLLT